MLSERQSPVVAGLALCAASAGHHVCVLLPCWSHTVETDRPQTEQTATKLHTCCVVYISNSEMKFARLEDQQVSLEAAQFVGCNDVKQWMKNDLNRYIELLIYRWVTEGL